MTRRRKWRIERLAGWAAALAVCAASQAQTPTGTEQQTPESTLDPRRLIEQALAKIESGDLQEARNLTERAGQLDPNLEQLKLAAGLLMIETSRLPGQVNRSPEALSLLEKYCASKDGANDYRGFAALGTLYLESRSYRLAIRTLEQGQKVAPLDENGKPKKGQITMTLARAHLGLESRLKALEAARAARQFAPRDQGLAVEAAEIAVACGPEFAKEALEAAAAAVPLIEASLVEDPFNREHAELLKRAFTVMGRSHSSMAQLNPTSAVPFIEFAKSQYEAELRNVDRLLSFLAARDAVLQAITRDASNMEYPVFLGELEAQIGAIKGSRTGLRAAADRLENVLKSEPSNQKAQQVLDQINRLLSGTAPTATQPAETQPSSIVP